MKTASLLAAAALAAVTFAADVPRVAPAAVFPGPNGLKIELAAHKGKVVVLEFLLTTCPHCQTTARILQQIQDEYASKGVVVLGVATNTTDAAVVNEFRATQRVRFPVGWSERTVVEGFLQHPVMRTMYMPQLVFIDRAGKIQSQHSGESAFFSEMSQAGNIRAEIERLLKSK